MGFGWVLDQDVVAQDLVSRMPATGAPFSDRRQRWPAATAAWQMWRRLAVSASVSGPLNLSDAVQPAGAAMSFAIRPYESEDYDWVLAAQVALQEHEIAIEDPRLRPTRLPGLPHAHDYLTLLWNNLADGAGIMLIARDGAGSRVGLVAGRIVDEPWPMETRDSSRYGYVSDIYIEPRARGSGLAPILLDAIADHLRAADPTLTRLRINVLAANAVARAAYEKAGFVPYEVMYERKL